MRCPICKCETQVLRIGDNLYRIECISIRCEYVDEFEYVKPLTPREKPARVAVAG